MDNQVFYECNKQIISGNGGFTAFPEGQIATPFTAWFGSVEKLKGRFNVLPQTLSPIDPE
jgi:hypothetical protein